MPEVRYLREMPTPNYLMAGAKPNDQGYAHGDAAAGMFRGPEEAYERALVTLAAGITNYTRAMFAESPAGTPHTIERVIAPMLDAWVEALSLPRGRLDGGACSAWAEHVYDAIGWDSDLGKFK